MGEEGKGRVVEGGGGGEWKGRRGGAGEGEGGRRRMRVGEEERVKVRGGGKELLVQTLKIKGRGNSGKM